MVARDGSLHSTNVYKSNKKHLEVLFPTSRLVSRIPKNMLVLYEVNGPKMLIQQMTDLVNPAFQIRREEEYVP